MPAGFHINLDGEAPSWAQALLYSAFVWAVASIVSAITLSALIQTSSAVLWAGPALGFVAASVYFSRSRLLVRALEDYVQAAATRLDCEARVIRARTFGRRTPAWHSLLMTHAVFVMLLSAPLLMAGIALESQESATFEHRMETVVTSQTSEIRPQIVESARIYERRERRAWLSAAAFIVLWVVAAAFVFTRDQAQVARLIRTAAQDVALRDERIAAAVTMAIEKKMLS